MIDFANWQQFEQADGAVWQVHDVDDGHLVVTSAGQDVLSDRPEIESYFHAYLGRALGSSALTGELVTRRFIASGARSSVYEMTSEIAVKEAHKTGSPLYALQRMNRLSTLIASGLPRWIDVPDQYAVLYASSLPKDYIFQRRVDSGVAAEWLLDQDALADYQREAVEREFGEVGEEEQETIAAACAEAEQLIIRALEEAGEIPRHQLIDYHPGNVLVERLRTPVAGKRHKLWVIDQ